MLVNMMYIDQKNDYIVLDLAHVDPNQARAAIDAAKTYVNSLRKYQVYTECGCKKIMKEIREIESALNKKTKFEEKSKEVKKELDELKDIKEEEQIFLRRLPKDSKSLQKVTESALSAKTRKNLKILAEKYNITWSDYYMYSVSQRFKIAHGYIIVNDRKDINYFRIETKNPSAGQTNIYYDGKTVQMTRLLNEDDQMYAKTKNSFKEFNRLNLLYERNRNASLHRAYRTQKV